MSSGSDVLLETARARGSETEGSTVGLTSTFVFDLTSAFSVLFEIAQVCERSSKFHSDFILENKYDVITFNQNSFSTFNKLLSVKKIKLHFTNRLLFNNLLKN